MAFAYSKSPSKVQLAIILALKTGGPLRTYTLAQIVLAAWQADHARFGLEGYERLFPDSAKVRANLFGAKGLLGWGLLQKTEDGRYRLNLQVFET